MPTVQNLNNLGAELYAANRLDEAAASYEQALRIQPGNFVAHGNLGNVLHAQGKAEKALDHYLQALKLRPNIPELYVNLGAAYWDLNRLDKSIECYEQALKLRPDYIDALVNYGTALWGQGDADAAAAKYEQVLRLQPAHVETITHLGALLHEKNRLHDALAMYDRVLSKRPGFADVLWRKSLILLALGDYREGWRLYEKGLGKRNLRGLNRFASPPWDGVPDPSKRLLIWGEQGLGDSLQFIRYAALCKERVGKVSVLCPKPLVRLFNQCPFIDRASDSFSTDDFDTHIAVMSLPHLFGTTLETVPATVPYLHVEPQARREWQARLSHLKGTKIGLVWAGNAREGQINANAIDRRRSLNLEQLLPLFHVENISFISLQMGKAAGQIDELKLRGHIADFMDDVEDFMDTAAIIGNLDLVITVDTSVAHLAGALAKPVWLLSRFDACWRWLGNRESNPWYPTARIFGQLAPGDWGGVIGHVRDSLAALAVSG